MRIGPVGLFPEEQEHDLQGYEHGDGAYHHAYQNHQSGIHTHDARAGQRTGGGRDAGMGDHAAGSQGRHHQEDGLLHLAGHGNGQGRQQNEGHIIKHGNGDDEGRNGQGVEGLLLGKRPQHGPGNAVGPAVVVKQLAHNDAQADGQSCALHEAAESRVNGAGHFRQIHARSDTHHQTCYQQADGRIHLQLLKEDVEKSSFHR